MVEGQKLSSAEALELRQLRILESIGNLEFRLSGTTKLESSGVAVAGGFSLENGDVGRVAKEGCDGEVRIGVLHKWFKHCLSHCNQR